MANDPLWNEAARWRGMPVMSPATYTAVQRFIEAQQTPATQAAIQGVVEQGRRFVESVVAPHRVEGLLSEATIAKVNEMLAEAVDVPQMRLMSERNREFVERFLELHGQRATQQLAEIAARDLSTAAAGVEVSAETMEVLVDAVDLETGRAAHAALAEGAPELTAAIDKGALVSDLRQFLSPQEVQWFLAGLVFMIVVWWHIQVGQVFPGQDEPNVLADLTEGVVVGFAAGGGAKAALGKVAGKRPPGASVPGPEDVDSGT